ncbi:MAG: hypothetical protein ACE5LU_20045 [Anaerolineae bacterium]
MIGDVRIFDVESVGVGNSAIITKSVTVGRGAIIAAGSVFFGVSNQPEQDIWLRLSTDKIRWIDKNTGQALN